MKVSKENISIKNDKTLYNHHQNKQSSLLTQQPSNKSLIQQSLLLSRMRNKKRHKRRSSSDQQTNVSEYESIREMSMKLSKGIRQLQEQPQPDLSFSDFKESRFEDKKESKAEKQKMKQIDKSREQQQTYSDRRSKKIQMMSKYTMAQFRQQQRPISTIFYPHIPKLHFNWTQLQYAKHFLYKKFDQHFIHIQNQLKCQQKYISRLENQLFKLLNYVKKHLGMEIGELVRKRDERIREVEEDNWNLIQRLKENDIEIQKLKSRILEIQEGFQAQKEEKRNLLATKKQNKQILLIQSFIPQTNYQVNPPYHPLQQSTITNFSNSTNNQPSLLQQIQEQQYSFDSLNKYQTHCHSQNEEFTNKYLRIELGERDRPYGQGYEEILPITYRSDRVINKRQEGQNNEFFKGFEKFEQRQTKSKGYLDRKAQEKVVINKNQDDKKQQQFYPNTIQTTFKKKNIKPQLILQYNQYANSNKSTMMKNYDELTKSIQKQQAQTNKKYSYSVAPRKQLNFQSQNEMESHQGDFQPQKKQEVINEHEQDSQVQQYQVKNFNRYNQSISKNKQWNQVVPQQSYIQTTKKSIKYPAITSYPHSTDIKNLPLIETILSEQQLKRTYDLSEEQEFLLQEIQKLRMYINENSESNNDRVRNPANDTMMKYQEQQTHYQLQTSKKPLFKQRNQEPLINLLKKIKQQLQQIKQQTYQKLLPECEYLCRQKQYNHYRIYGLEKKQKFSQRQSQKQRQRSKSSFRLIDTIKKK